jgi:hypothetical protein
MATPLSIQTTPSFASLTGTAPITIPVPLTAAATPSTATLGSIVLPITNAGGRVFVEGTIPLALSLTIPLPALAVTGGIEVTLSVYRSATSTTPIYNVRKTLFSAIGLAIALAATTFYDILPFQFVETPGVPLCANTASYFFTLTVVTTGLTIAAGSAVVVNSPLPPPPAGAIPEVFNIIAEEVPDPITVTTTTTTVIS